jgi:hypothetical protein
MLMELHNRTTAATTIQSAWRARVERHAFAPAWDAHQRAKREATAAATIQLVGGAALRIGRGLPVCRLAALICQIFMRSASGIGC